MNQNHDLLNTGVVDGPHDLSFPELTQEDILAVLAYAADREHQFYSLMVQ